MTSRDALNKLCKWRMLLVGRLIGTRSSEDPQAKGYRDLIDKLLILRAEQSALSRLLIEKRLVTVDEWHDAVAAEALALDKMYETTFPGWHTEQHGCVAHHVETARKTMEGWPV